MPPTPPKSTPKSAASPVAAGSHAKNSCGYASSQKSLQDMSKMTLFDKLTYQYLYDVESKFPAYIWQTWKSTSPAASLCSGATRSRPADAVHLLRPRGHHRQGGREPDPPALRVGARGARGLRGAVAAAAVLKADFFRYLILLARGGIYLDIDTHAIKSAERIPKSVPHEMVGLGHRHRGRP